MRTIVLVCIAIELSAIGCTISITVEIEPPKTEQTQQRKPATIPKPFYNPATVEDYDQAHRYLERNPEKPPARPSKELWEPELYGPS